MTTGRPRRKWREVLLLFLVLAAVVWVLRLRRDRPGTPAWPDFRLDGSFGEIAQVRFAQGADTFLITRRGIEYWLERPFVERADALFLEEVQRQARELRVVRVLPDTLARVCGLDPPQGTVRLRSAAGRDWELEIGDETPVGGQLYARPARPGAPIVLLEAFTTRKYFLPKPNDLRDPVAAALGPGPPDSVAVLVAGRELRARRVSQDRWVARKPDGLEVDPQRVNSVIQLLRGPNLLDFPPDVRDVGETGLAAPRAIWILYQGARRETVCVGRATPDLTGIYVLPSRRARPAILSAEQYRALVDGWPALADRRLLSLRADSIHSLEFLGGAPAGYRRDDDRWVRLPSGQEIRRLEALRIDVGNLALLQWRAWPVQPEPPPPGARKLRLRVASRTAAETLQIASAGDTLAWARSSRRPLWGRIPETTWSTWSYRLAHPE